MALSHCAFVVDVVGVLFSFRLGWWVIESESVSKEFVVSVIRSLVIPSFGCASDH